MSDKTGRLNVVVCWHMHQPDYRGPDHSDYQLPWVYLHGIKDYTDMLNHLEEHAEARAVVNFTPILLEQIEDYRRQINAWLSRGKRIRDPLLSALAGPGLPLDLEGRAALVSACHRANEHHLINRFPAFRGLIDIAGCVRNDPAQLHYLNDQYLADLLVWYHLAWMGESVRENDLRVASLEKKARGFDLEDRRRLVTLIRDQLQQIVPRYKRLARGGRVELAVTPHSHPILPLLLDLREARAPTPEVRLPELPEYPGGEARARWHVRRGIEVFKRYFGFKPSGCWPAEGGVSDQTLRLLEEEGFLWAASGQQVLANSCRAAFGDTLPPHWAHRPYRIGKGRLTAFFRDDGLSDLIGFTYADWHADDAVNNLIQHLEHIHKEVGDDPDAIVSIIMDGENAWEYYPRNGAFFLSSLYKRLAQHPRLRMTTYSEYLKGKPQDVIRLPHLVSGSWVYGTFTTWIGDKDKNRAWDMLGDAKNRFDEVVASGRLTPRELEAAERQLATCEGSDWFWWFGDYNPGHTVSDFEQLFRRQLSHLYRLLGEEPPGYLSKVFAHGAGEPTRGGVMRQSQL
jgi:alpha-amylase/alpha-mannosidase (GH57 family)